MYNEYVQPWGFIHNYKVKLSAKREITLYLSHYPFAIAMCGYNFVLAESLENVD